MVVVAITTIIQTDAGSNGRGEWMKNKLVVCGQTTVNESNKWEREREKEADEMVDSWSDHLSVERRNGHKENPLPTNFGIFSNTVSCSWCVMVAFAVKVVLMLPVIVSVSSDALRTVEKGMKDIEHSLDIFQHVHTHTHTHTHTAHTLDRSVARPAVKNELFFATLARNWKNAAQLIRFRTGGERREGRKKGVCGRAEKRMKNKVGNTVLVLWSAVLSVLTMAVSELQ